MRSVLIFLSMIFFSLKASAQGEILCTVNIDVSPNVQLATADKAYLNDAKTAMTNLMNNTKWTNDVFTQDERIRCNLFITVTDVAGQGVFVATAQIQSSRPVYGTSYDSEILNFFDKKFNFQYSQQQIVNFNENTYNSNLTSLIGFYAYIILALDYDSFSKLGGQAYVEKARSVANIAYGNIANEQTVPGMDAWDPNEGNNNRYWLAENLNNQQVIPFREGLYSYHRLGMDKYLDTPEAARTEILNVLTKIKAVNAIKPYAVLIRSFFTAKSTELINIFTDATPEQKQSALELLRVIDPLNSAKYNAITQ
ncbi:MAG: DUF4835 family protein [Cytophagaceae bacterium]